MAFCNMATKVVQKFGLSKYFVKKKYISSKKDKKEVGLQSITTL